MSRLCDSLWHAVQAVTDIKGRNTLMARLGRVDKGLVMMRNTAGQPVWYVRLWHHGKGRQFGSFRTKTEARDFYEKAKQEQRNGKFFPERYQKGGYEFVQEMIDRYLLTIGTKKDQRGQRCFARWWGARLKGKRLNHVTPELLERLRHELLTKGSDPHAQKPKPCSPQRVNRYMEWIRHLFNIAERDDKIHSNPVKKLTKFREPTTKTRFLTLEEEAKLCEALAEPYASWMRFAILTGLRRMEQFSLRWADVDLERGILTLPRTKAGDVQYAHLNEEAKGLLRQMTTWESSIWVFPSEHPARHIDPCNFYRRVFLPAVKRNGLEGVTWHTLRHTFASRLAMVGATDHDIAVCLRHSGTTLVRRYAHLSPGHLKGLMERVSTFGEQPK